tara:strand:- start:2972 stop:4030 length:1059 start_codon:yes stop_codon:yes gene_type:complete
MKSIILTTKNLQSSKVLNKYIKVLLGGLQNLEYFMRFFQKQKKTYSLKNKHSNVNGNILILSFCLLSIVINLQAQNSDDFAFFELRLQNLANEILNAETDSLKNEANKLLIEDVEELLTMRGSFEYIFEIDQMSIIKSPNKKFNFYNWVVPFENGTFEYYGYIQMKKRRKKELFFIKLSDKSAITSNEQYKSFSDGNWFGALYTDIVVTRYQKKNYYTLLGWDGNNNRSSKRIVEILYFNENDQPIFGAPIIKMNDGTRNRMILEYSKQASISIKYDPEEQHIIFDHLEPLDGVDYGMFEFYVPSLSYDGLVFKNGKWRLLENLPVYNSKDQDPTQEKIIERGLQRSEQKSE